MHAALLMLLLASTPAPPAQAELPLVGAGEYAPGKPWRVADRRVLLNLLRHGRYGELTLIVEGYQAAFEADPSKEYWPSTAFDAFEVSDAKTLEQINGWIAHDPHSFAPYMARAAYYYELGWHRRGGDWASKTSRKQFKGMGDAHYAAVENLRTALQLHPKLVDAYRMLLGVAMADGATEKERREVLNQGLAICPTCLRVRVYYMNAIAPRWGGSYEEMDAFAKESQQHASENPALRVLLGAADDDRCDSMRKTRGLDAIDLCTAALRHGPYAPYLETRSHAYVDVNMYDAARDDAEAALAMWPYDDDSLDHHAWVLMDQGHHAELAMKDVQLLEELNPAYSDLPDLKKQLANELVRDSQSARTDHKMGKVFRLLCEASAWDPKNQVVVALARAQAPHGRHLKHVKAPATLDAAVALDRKLSAENDFDACIDLWTDFLAHHPDVTRAYLERAGAHMRRYQLAATRADFDAACKLGDPEGCTKLRELAEDEVK